MLVILPLMHQIEMSVTEVWEDSLGQEVATIFEGYQPAGNYIAEFDAAKLASGVYFYRLQSDNVSIAKKLIHMK